MRRDVEVLLEDYKMRLYKVDEILEDSLFMLECASERYKESKTKEMCYKTVIYELERILNKDEN